MLIGVEKEFVFIANTKAASTAMENALFKHAEIQYGGNPGRKHISWRKVRRKFDFLNAITVDWLDQAHSFAIMRDPIDWTLSWYNYRRRETVRNQHSSLAEKSFEAFFKEQDWVFRNSTSGKRKYQRDKFECKRSGTKLTQIIRYEELKDSLPALSKTLGLKKGLFLQQLNASTPFDGRRLTRDQLAPATLDTLKDFWAHDYAFYDAL